MNKPKIVYTQIIIDWETGKAIHRDGYPFSGRWADLKGPTTSQTQIAGAQANFFNTLSSSFNTMFAGQTGILQSLQSAFQPILAAGPNQFGFSPMELSVMKGQAVDTTAATFAANQAALNQALAARGGGTSFLPSGAQAQLQQQGYTAASQQESNLLNQITQAGYAQGRQNFLQAANVLGGAASMYNPTGFAGATTGAGQAAASTAGTIAQEKAAASPWGAIGGILGGAASAFMGNPQGLLSMFQQGSQQGPGPTNLSYPTGADFGTPGPAPTLTMPTDMGASVLGAGVVPSYAG